MSRDNRGKPPPYTLVAVLVHKGLSCDRGHYIAYVRKGKDWYLANDEVVTKVDVSEVLKAQAYVLVYEVEGMKEKHNFDCYSRYHESCDDKGDDAQDREHPHAMWDFSSISNILEACDVGFCGNPLNLTARNSDHKVTKKPSKSKIEDFRLDTKTDEDFNCKQYKRGRSYTPSQRVRNSEGEDEEDIRNRSFNGYNKLEQRDNESRRRIRSSSLVEKKSKEKVASTKAPRRKNSDRDGTLPPLKPRSDSPKK
jgi:hypothetical protein